MRSERGPGEGARPDWSEWEVDAKGEEEGDRPDWVIDGPRADAGAPAVSRPRPEGRPQSEEEPPRRRRAAGAAQAGPAVRPIGEWAPAERGGRGGRRAAPVAPVRAPAPAESPWGAEPAAEPPAVRRRPARRAEPVAEPVVERTAEPEPTPTDDRTAGDWTTEDWVAEAEAELAADSARSRRRRGRRAAGDGEPREQRPTAETDPATRAREICLRLLTGTARTRKQLADALRKREIPEEVAEEVLSRFEEVGLIDDTAFAAAWVESRHAGRGLARRALARELRNRGVAGAVVEEAVAQLDPEDEAVAARALVDRKLRGTAGLDRQVRIRRLVGVLARRGYPEGLAFRVVRDALEAEGESTEELEQWSPEDD
ncbi:RecX family transcriptional regulator [Kitasatospora sp. NPDC006697]|uniref:RecX family transcriptional regulator n=1 Tax=Kitasatospora sp. NPDC006697 TaxID=3364020 RepID=UPI0036CF02BC